MAYIITGLTALTGGTAGSLDKIDGGELSDGDIAEVITSTGRYLYRLDATASATENSPLRINPDSNAGTKSWCLLDTSVFIGATVSKSSVQSIPASSLTQAQFDTEDEDTGGFYDSGSPNIFTIPVGVTRVKVSASLVWESNNIGYRYITISGITGMIGKTMRYIAAYESEMIYHSIPSSVSGGESVGANMYQASGSAQDLTMVFHIEAVEFG